MWTNLPLAVVVQFDGIFLQLRHQVVCGHKPETEKIKTVKLVIWCMKLIWRLVTWTLSRVGFHMWSSSSRLSGPTPSQQQEHVGNIQARGGACRAAGGRTWRIKVLTHSDILLGRFFDPKYLFCPADGKNTDVGRLFENSDDTFCCFKSYICWHHVKSNIYSIPGGTQHTLKPERRFGRVWRMNERTRTKCAVNSPAEKHHAKRKCNYLSPAEHVLMQTPH